MTLCGHVCYVHDQKFRIFALGLLSDSEVCMFGSQIRLHKHVHILFQYCLRNGFNRPKATVQQIAENVPSRILIFNFLARIIRVRHVFRKLLYVIQTRLSFNGYTRNRTEESISLSVFTIPANPFTV